MHATFLQTVLSGKFQQVTFFCGAMAIALSMLWPISLSAQEADGDFEGEKTWKDKAGNSHDIKAPTSKDKDNKARNTMFAAGKVSEGGDDDIFENWSQHFVRSLTWKDNITNLPTARKDLKKQLMRLGKAPVPDLHTRLNNLALQVCTAVAKDARYPRAVRINCTLMLAEFDEREYNAGANQQAVVLPAATSALIDMVTDTKLPAFIRLEAEVALLRHTQFGMAPGLQPKVVEALLRTMQTPIVEGKDMQGQVWLRFRASDVLLSMLDGKIAFDQTALATALAALIGNENLPFWARATYAGDLGRLDGKSVAPAKIDEGVRTLAGLMLAISEGSPFVAEETAEEAAEPDADKKESGKKDTDKKDGNKKDAGKKEKDKKEADKKDDPDKKDEKKAAPANDALTPAAQKLLSEEMIWQLARIRRALVGKEALTPRDNAPDAAHGLHAGANDAEKANIVKIAKHIDDAVKSLADVPDKLDKLADTLNSANQDLEDFLSSPATEQATAQATKDGATRTGAPRGNAPPGASTVNN